MTTAAVEAPLICSETTVVSVSRLGRSYVRLVVAGPELSSWSAEVVDPGTVGDAYVKVLVPPPGGGGVAPDVDDIRGWLALPESERGWMRTYTVRRADRVELEGRTVPALTIDLVIHPGADEGPGSAWAGTVRVGDTVRLLGPGRGHAPWGAWAPGEAGRVVCAGDETAVPALLAIAEELAAEPVGTREARVLMEVPTAADAEELGAGLPDFVTIVVRGDEPGTALVHELAGVPYLFLAGEAALVRAMRRLAVDAAGVHKSSVAFMGYWRRGAAES